MNDIIYCENSECKLNCIRCYIPQSDHYATFKPNLPLDELSYCEFQLST